MPQVQFVCPHCDRHAEVQVASVTRSRACPHCGHNVLLQVTGKQQMKSRRALLVTPAGSEPQPEQEVPARGTPAYVPQPLEGEVFERMKADPEIRAIRRRLIGGAVLVVGLIILSIAWHFMGPGTAATDDEENIVAASEASRPSASPGVPDAAVGAANSPALDRAEGPTRDRPPHGKLVFVTRAGSSSEGAASETAEARLVLVKEALTAFLGADTVDKLLPFVANRSQVEPAVRAYYTKYSLKPIQAADIQRFPNAAARADEAPMLVTLSTGAKIRATVLATADGQLGVDWPSFVALSDMEWNEFFDSKPAAPVMFRVVAEAGDWYAGTFADASKYRCIKLTDPHDHASSSYFAYAERAGVIGQEMTALIRDHTGPFPLTVRVKYPQDATAAHQVLLDSVVADGWLVRSAGAITQAGK